VKLAPLPKRVANPGRLDLDDLGTKPGEHRSSEGTSDELAKLEHAQTGEGVGAHGPHHTRAGCYQRQADGSWLLRALSRGAILRLGNVNGEIAVDDVYRNLPLAALDPE